jgi:hypothetical protein
MRHQEIRGRRTEFLSAGSVRAERGTRQSGGDFWNVEQLSAAVNATKPSSKAKALSASRSQERKPTSSSITGLDWETAGKTASMSASKAWVHGSRLPPSIKQLF